MEDDKAKRYRFPETLDAEMKIIFFSLDEFILAMTPPAVLFYFFNDLLVGLILGALLYLGIKQLKKGKDSRWLYSWLYWYLPDFIFCFYRVVPRSSWRKWL